jgi:hypothetical protein
MRRKLLKISTEGDSLQQLEDSESVAVSGSDPQPRGVLPLQQV